MDAAEQEITAAPLLVLVGPTAIGKTGLSLDMAARFNCEIVSMDSMQVYRYMDIGTAKPDRGERSAVVHHLIDIIDPDEQYNAARFIADGLAAIAGITAAGRVPLLTGGTGLYLKALTQGLFEEPDSAEHSLVRRELRNRMRQQGREALFQELRRLDPDTAGRIHPNDTQRLLRALEVHRLTGRPWSENIRRRQEPPVRLANMFLIGLTCDRRELYERIERRTGRMMELGLVEEVEMLREMGYDPLLPSMQAIGYRHVNNFLDGRWTREEAVRLLVRDTRRYAKRQMTWFTRMESIRWYHRDRHDKILQDTERWLHSRV
ncbi:MAG TPA: tRNA (adenosine(37)-N6)-dimethylallyltransferase MiaA [Desulfobacteraceae bacterium]|nr:tRNA (adenosine(37)-N6)-dimethylallyltransferase MiaA [Desulfobacteraceae bacterium]